MGGNSIQNDTSCIKVIAMHTAKMNANACKGVVEENRFVRDMHVWLVSTSVHMHKVLLANTCRWLQKALQCASCFRMEAKDPPFEHH